MDEDGHDDGNGNNNNNNNDSNDNSDIKVEEKNKWEKYKLEYLLIACLKALISPLQL